MMITLHLFLEQFLLTQTTPAPFLPYEIFLLAHFFFHLSSCSDLREPMTIFMLHSLIVQFYTENRQDKTRRQSPSNCVNSTISTHICDNESVLFIIPFSTTEQVWH